MAETNIVEQIDAYFAKVLSDWNIYSTAIAVLLVTFLLYPLFTSREPDTHPLLLSRQSSVAPVRQPGESAVYRSNETPHGYPLKSGLGVKDPGAPKWSGGRNGDLRDIWRQTVQGPKDKEGKPTGQKGKILTVLGMEQIIDHDLDGVSREINIIGEYIQQHRGQRVAIYLPNSIEFLITLFATAFYSVTPIIIPFNLPAETLVKILEQTKPDFLVAAAGSVPLSEVLHYYRGLKQVIWVVEEGSRHMDWNDVPEGIGGQAEIGVFNEIVDERKASASSNLPDNTTAESLKDIVTVWQRTKEDEGEIVEFTHKNMVAAIAGFLSSLPAHQRICASDLFLPVDPLSNLYALTVTLAALYSNASVALNSSTGPKTDLDLATRSISPTIVVASAETVSNTIEKTRASMTHGWHNLVHWFETRALTLSGHMPVAGIFTHLFDYMRPSIGEQPGKLRLLYVAERCGADCPLLESGDLSDLRAFTGARVIYALTAAKVAGAVTQTLMYDYRREETKGKHAHFGVPLSCVEVKVVDTETHKNTEDGDPVGEIVVTGPAVAGGQAFLGVNGTFRDDGTLAYL